MPRYLITHPAGQHGADIVIDDPYLTLTIQGAWVVFADMQGVCLAVPAESGATITRVDEPDGRPR